MVVEYLLSHGQRPQDIDFCDKAMLLLLPIKRNASTNLDEAVLMRFC